MLLDLALRVEAFELRRSRMLRFMKRFFLGSSVSRLKLLASCAGVGASSIPSRLRHLRPRPGWPRFLGMTRRLACCRFTLEVSCKHDVQWSRCTKTCFHVLHRNTRTISATTHAAEPCSATTFHTSRHYLPALFRPRFSFEFTTTSFVSLRFYSPPTTLLVSPTTLTNIRVYIGKTTNTFLTHEARTDVTTATQRTAAGDGEPGESSLLLLGFRAAGELKLLKFRSFPNRGTIPET